MNWYAHYERVLRELLPTEFPSARPVYVVGRWDLDRRYLLDLDDAFAMTHVMLDVWLRPHLEETGRWRGRGFATVLYERHFHAVDAWCRRELMLDVLLHEAAHYFQDGDERLAERAGEIGRGDAAVAFVGMAAYRNAAAENRAEGLASPSAPWAVHGADFIRAGLHIVHRVRSRGYATTVDRVRLSDFGLAPEAAYADALGDEPARRCDEPLEDVMRDAPPATYLEFAEADEARALAEWGADRATV